MRSTIVSAGLLALTLLGSQAALARPITLDATGESDLALRNSDMVSDGLELEARNKKAIQIARPEKQITQKDVAARINEKSSILQDYESGNAKPNPQNVGKVDRAAGVKLRSRQIFDQLEARAKSRSSSIKIKAATKGRGNGVGARPRSGAKPQQRQRTSLSRGNQQPRRQRQRSGSLRRILRSPVTSNIATTLASGVAQRIANGGGVAAAPAEGYERREFEEYLEARTRYKGQPRRSNPVPRRSSGLGRTLNRALNSQTGQTIVSTLAQGVAQRIANGGGM